jgi:hypothetical protein
MSRMGSKLAPPESVAFLDLATRIHMSRPRDRRQPLPGGPECQSISLEEMTNAQNNLPTILAASQSCWFCKLPSDL